MKAPFRVAEETVWDACYNIAEYLGKLRNDWRVKDEYLIRYGALGRCPVLGKDGGGFERFVAGERKTSVAHPRLSRRLGN